MDTSPASNSKTRHFCSGDIDDAILAGTITCVTFFETLLALLAAAVLLLQVSRRLLLPYPAMLAAAGVCVAFLPGTPTLSIEPHTALALFIAPVVVDAAFDFPLGAAFRFLRPLLAFAVFAVLATTALVAWLAHHFLGLPPAAAVALGAIVAPPDAAAASAVLSSVSVPRSAEEVLKGESLFNDATALLLFTGALIITTEGALTLPHALHVGAAVPGGLLLGYLWARALRSLNPFFADTLGGNLMQFVNTYLIWIVAEHLGLSAILATIAFAMTLARSPELRGRPRMRVQSFAVWSAVVFTLNVLAFLIMGMQARSILRHMQGASLAAAARFAGLVVMAVIVARLVLVVGFNRADTLWSRLRHKAAPPGVRQAVFVGWSGMRGFVTLATAFALPTAFPQRDAAVLTAFAVVLGTLVLQGLTLRPLIKLLGLDQDTSAERELREGRSSLAGAALKHLRPETDLVADNLRFTYSLEQHASQRSGETRLPQRRRDLGLGAVAAERNELEELRNRNSIGIDAYLQLQEEIDWRELTLLREDERRIEES